MDAYEEQLLRIKDGCLNKMNMSEKDARAFATFVKTATRFEEYKSTNLCGTDFIEKYNGFYYDGENDQTLAGKCISRAGIIHSMQLEGISDTELSSEVNSARNLWEVLKEEFLPLEILWGMEHSSDDAYGDPISKNSFNYLKEYAKFYLEETDELMKKLSVDSEIRDTKTL